MFQYADEDFKHSNTIVKKLGTSSPSPTNTRVHTHTHTRKIPMQRSAIFFEGGGGRGRHLLHIYNQLYAVHDFHSKKDGVEGHFPRTRDLTLDSPGH